MSYILLLLSILLLFLAAGISRSVFDGTKGGKGKKPKLDRAATRRRLGLAWVLAGCGGLLLLISYLMDS